MMTAAVAVALSLTACAAESEHTLELETYSPELATLATLPSGHGTEQDAEPPAQPAVEQPVSCEFSPSGEMHEIMHQFFDAPWCQLDCGDGEPRLVCERAGAIYHCALEC